ncbi:F-box and leucine-rich protein 22 isoform X1 [Mirounga angustirostris]|uniref:F-box and leucine-rich protein 22 isoform X1 n=1 Tax=Mirounga angustirostris TaxID=9716 RepID=UPI0023E3C227|nr:F-box and leucine-rich protein 22 isoform X1 [Mirounga angustirostris]
MHITQLNRECLLHLFSFLDKDSRKNLARTCPQLQDVFEDPALWPLLHFRSLLELKKDNFLLSPALRSLSICWYSSRVQVCSIEDWLKSAFQKSICSRHESLVNDFLLQVCDRLRPRHRRLPGVPAALLPAPARAAPGELRARHQPHAGCRGGARARAADAARGLLPQRERRRPAPPARRVPAPGAAGRAQRSHDPGPAPERARHGRSQAAAALGRPRRGTTPSQGPRAERATWLPTPAPPPPRLSPHL